MSQLTLIAVAHAIHVAAGVVWAGSVFLLVLVVSPIAAAHAADGAARWAGLVARRAAPLMGISALLTVLSGIYLFVTLHRHDDSAGGFVLRAGALAALLALASGVFITGPAGRRLAKLERASRDDAAGPASPVAAPADVLALRRRAILSSRASAALLGAAVLSMALFRYASAWGG